MKKQAPVKLRVIPGVLIIAILAAALVYFTGVVYFRDRFPFHTSFLGYDISQRTADAIDECMTAESEIRQLDILRSDGQIETLDLAEDIGYRRVISVPEGGWIPAGQCWRWPESLRRSTVLTGDVSITYDPALLEEAVFSLSAMDTDATTPPKNARLVWRDGVCEIEPEDDGDRLYFPRTVQAVRNAVESDSALVDLAAENCYRRASIRSDNAYLTHELSRYTAINFQRVEIDVTGETIVLTPDDVLAFYTEDETGELVLSPDAISSYTAELKDRYDTYERARPFTNRYGEQILVGTPADTYGFKMDADATAARMTEVLESREREAVFEPVWINRALARDDRGCDIGDTYIEISIDEQYLWAYLDGKEALSTPVVTGMLAVHDTPRGVFRILFKQRDAVLVGDDYETPVSFWMPITWRGVGLHDATWRSGFGGGRYTDNGSHGCVNLPYWVADDLYSWYDAGTPVVIW